MSIVQKTTLATEIRSDFPILQRLINGKPLVYFDNAATSQKPRYVIDALSQYYELYNSNVHRGIHSLSSEATDAYEEARNDVAKFINTKSRNEIVFTRNGTEAINLVANTWGGENLKRGDEIIVSIMEHHSNIVPWQLIAIKTGAILKFVELTETGEFDFEHFKSLVSRKTKLVCVAHISNTLGCINPLMQITKLAHTFGAKVLVDACQSVPHMSINVQSIDCDWLVASGHKMCGSTGSGFLYGKSDILKNMPPFLGGGQMIDAVFREYSTYADIPYRFEAGTPAIAESIGLGAAVRYLTKIGMDRIHTYEEHLTKYLFEKLKKVPGIKIYGPKPNKLGEGRAALVSFNIEGIHPYDLSTILDQEGIAIRVGHHCTQPLHRHLEIESSARASLYFYNTIEEIDVFVTNLIEAKKFLSGSGL